jgi:rusticyanin
MTMTTTSSTAVPKGATLGLRRILAVAGALVVLLSGCSAVGGQPGVYGPGMMGGGGMMGVAGAGTATASVGLSEAMQLGQAIPAGATIDRATSTVTFTASDVELVVLAAPSDGPDETFRIAGLTNPTIVVPPGARVALELINADGGMPHNWLLTTAEPPFGPMSMMMTPVGGAATGTLPEATASSMLATSITFVAPASGRYTYLCSVPGHAEKGMYGRLIVLGGN